MVSFEVIVNLIADTTTITGLEIQAELDTNAYPKGRTVSDTSSSTRGPPR